MPTPFENAAAMASAAVDAVYGESFQLIAMKSRRRRQCARLADSTRPTFFAVGAYLAPFKAILPHARGSIQDDNAHKFAASTPMVSIDNANLQWPVETGDRVLRMATGDLFEVSKPLPDGIRRTVLHLTLKKRNQVTLVPLRPRLISPTPTTANSSRRSRTGATTCCANSHSGRLESSCRSSRRWPSPISR
jgi:hypothetical protein